MHSMQPTMSCILFVASLLYISFIGTVEGRTVKCTPCQNREECELDPPDHCWWGVVRNNCGRKMCARGPGQRCGGPENIFGKCGNGMWCHQQDEYNHETCHGCYDNTLVCHPDEYK